MRLRTVAATVFATGILLGGAASTASAGEITGKITDSNFKATQGPAHANSICTFSGLADGGEGEPAGPGAPPQNWGHDKEFFGDTPADRKASGFQPGDSCNGNTGFLSGGGEEP
jgi:hypothetical protein